jgi:hypothetical protein
MLAFRYEAHQYVGGHCAHDLKLDVLHVDDQMMDALYDLLLGVQMIYVLGDQCVVQLNEYLMNEVLTCVTYRLLALMNENVRILELRGFHQLAFQRVA